jgi:hypothetical protein
MPGKSSKMTLVDFLVTRQDEALFTLGTSQRLLGLCSGIQQLTLNFTQDDLSHSTESEDGSMIVRARFRTIFILFPEPQYRIIMVLFCCDMGLLPSGKLTLGSSESN